MEYEEIAPPAALEGIVRCFWTLRSVAPRRGDVPADPAFPDGSPELILNFGAPFEHRPPKGRPVRQPAAFLVGQITRPMYVRPTGRIDLLAVRFEAHGASLLHRPMRTLTDRWVALDRLARRSVGASSVAATLRSVRGARRRAARLPRLITALEAIKASRPAQDARVAAGVRAIRDSHGMVPLPGLSRATGLTPRSLQRLFADQVGIGPKHLARIVRFQRVFAAFRSDPASLSRVALECGYYDQPHLVRDFREFAGEAPARLLADTPEFTAFFTA